MGECDITKEKMHQIYRRIGENVKRYREQKNITQLALSIAIGHRSVGTVSMAEKGINNKHFNIEHLVRIAMVLDIDICKFFEGVSENEDAPVPEDTQSS